MGYSRMWLRGESDAVPCVTAKVAASSRHKIKMTKHIHAKYQKSDSTFLLSNCSNQVSKNSLTSINLLWSFFIHIQIDSMAKLKFIVTYNGIKNYKLQIG